MYVILMQTDKTLVQRNKVVIYQREKLVDKIRFLIPQTYENINLSDCMVVLKYLDQGNVAHSEVLVKEEELYKDHLSYMFPVNTNLTAFAGDVKLRLSFLRLNTENGLHEEVLHSGETIITVQSLADYYAFQSDNSLEIIDQAMLELETKIQALNGISEIYDKEKADNIVQTVENNDIKIQLSSNGQLIGDKVTVGNDGKDGVPVLDLDTGEVPSEEPGKTPDEPIDPDMPDEDEGSDVVEF